jgi:hypothetical protein
MSYAAFMLFRSEPPCTNALRFATAAEATAYGADLFARWTQPTGFEVRVSDDPVTHRWYDGMLENANVRSCSACGLHHGPDTDCSAELEAQADADARASERDA